MTSNPASMVPQLHQEVQHLRTSVTGPEARSPTAYPGELPRCRRRLALGAARWRRFLVRRAAVRPAEPVIAPDGTRWTDHDQRPTTSYAVFGHVRLWRHCFTAPGPHGRCPLDAAISLPARGASARLRAWAVDGTTDESSRES